MADGAMPGLNVVRFFDENMGLAAGDGTDREPSGLWLTRDGGRTWTARPGHAARHGGAPTFAMRIPARSGGAWGPARCGA